MLRKCQMRDDALLRSQMMAEVPPEIAAPQSSEASGPSTKTAVAADKTSSRVEVALLLHENKPPSAFL